MRLPSQTFQGQVSTSGRPFAPAPGSCVSKDRSGRRQRATRAQEGSAGVVTLLDYGAGNVRSVRNAIKQLGYTLKEVERPSDILEAEKLLFPGVGAFEQAMGALKARGYVEALREYIQADKPFFGICLGLQLLFEGSEENGGIEGLGLIPGRVQKFEPELGLPVPHIGWNDLDTRRYSQLLSKVGDDRLYFVHSFRALPSSENDDWILATTKYGTDFISVLERGNISATQFHPEKSGAAGLAVLRGFLEKGNAQAQTNQHTNGRLRGLGKRVIACLDVRSNDQGDLVVTKGDQYDVRETGGSKDVRNLGMPVDLAARYFKEGADEVTFLNITGFRDFPLGDMPMLQVLKSASEKVFVPLTVGGGIKEFTDASGRFYSALDVAAEYFRSGADKVSIGSDAVDAAEKFLRTGVKSGTSSIEQISWAYGAQAVVVSVDPRRVYVGDPASVKHETVRTEKIGPCGEKYVWWQCTVKGGREGRDIGAIELCKAVEELGAGEILLNCIDNDGQGNGFDLELVRAVSEAVGIPVIASSGAGKPEHFSEVFSVTDASAALAAGIFHRQEVGIRDVKVHLESSGIAVRKS